MRSGGLERYMRAMMPLSQFCEKECFWRQRLSLEVGSVERTHEDVVHKRRMVEGDGRNSKRLRGMVEDLEDSN